MLDPYRMVVVNVISLFTLLGGLLLYKFIFPKKKINLLILLILISILPIISIFRIGSYESGDFNIHIYRIMSFYKSLSEGHLMPSWAGSLNATYGYPLFIFNYALPYYLISLFYLLGFSFINSLKIFLGLNLMLSGIFMFLFSKNLFKKNLPAFTSSIFYSFAPYHLIDLHFKVVIGEILFFTIFPLAFLFLHKLLNKRTVFSLLMFALLFAGLIISHLAIALFAGILMLLYALFNLPKNNFISNISWIAVGFCISIIISSYQLLGPLLLSEFSYIQNVVLHSVYFPTMQDLLYAPWRMGLLFQGPKGEISFLLGYAHLFVIFFLLILFLRKRIPKHLFHKILFWFISFVLTIFLILPYSKPLWELFSTLKVVGSHRLLILTSFISSILAGYLAFVLKKQWLIYVLVAIAIGSTILNWGQRRVVPEITDSVLQKNIAKSTYETEGHFYANTKWVDVKNPWFSKPPKNHLEIINGIGNVKDISRTSTFHKYVINAQTPLSIQENTLYFPGWKGFANGKEIVLSPSSKGIIRTFLPKGIFVFEIKYEDIFAYRLLKIISFSTLILATIMTILSAAKSRTN